MLLEVKTMGVFANHIILNNPSRETISAGLGPVEQYGIILLAFIIIVIIAYFIKRKKKKSEISMFSKEERTPKLRRSEGKRKSI